MSRRSEHRPPPPAPQPSTVVTEPATPEAAAADYADRSGGTPEHPSSLAAGVHTWGRKP